jgi:hypothetical protein
VGSKGLLIKQSMNALSFEVIKVIGLEEGVRRLSVGSSQTSL